MKAGQIADRVGTYWPVMLGSAGIAAGLAIPYFFRGLPVLYVSALVMGMSMVFLNISLQYLVASLGGAEQRTRNVSMQSLAIATGAMIGPLLVGFSIDHRGHVPTFLYLALLVAASTIAAACSGGTSGWMPCPRLKTWPCPRP